MATEHQLALAEARIEELADENERLRNENAELIETVNEMSEGWRKSNERIQDLCAAMSVERTCETCDRNIDRGGPNRDCEGVNWQTCESYKPRSQRSQNARQDENDETAPRSIIDLG